MPWAISATAKPTQAYTIPRRAAPTAPASPPATIILMPSTIIMTTDVTPMMTDSMLMADVSTPFGPTIGFEVEPLLLSLQNAGLLAAFELLQGPLAEPPGFRMST